MGRLVLDVSGVDKHMDVSAWTEANDVWGYVVKCGGNEYLRDENGVLEPFKTKYGDRGFDRLYAQVESLGLHVGSYYYSSATTPGEAREEARHCLGLLEGKSFDLPIYMDVEEGAQFSSDVDLTAVVTAFCEVIEAAGHRAGIYSNTEGFMLMEDSVCRYSLWLAYWGRTRPSWARPERGYDIWQQGSMTVDGTKVFKDGGSGYVDYNWWIGSEGGTDMGLRERYVDLVRSQLGVRYWSMHEGPRGCGEEGWGCAKLAAWGLNELLGTSYYGSCYEFAGDALGEDASLPGKHNQGGGEFEWVDDPQPGDLCIYRGRGFDGRDSEDYGHIGIYVGDGTVISALGQGVPGGAGYLGDPDAGWGVQEHDPDYCVNMRGSSLAGYRYMRCVRLDAKPKTEPKAETKTEQETEETTTMQCMIQCDGKIYYWDGSPETVPYHVSPEQKSAIEDLHRKVTGKAMRTVELGKAAFSAILSMTKARKQWREQGIAAVIPDQQSAEEIAKVLAEELKKSE